MHTLRQSGGLSGFAKRSESQYDCFGAGHSSTSISSAMGMSVGKAQLGKVMMGGVTKDQTIFIFSMGVEDGGGGRIFLCVCDVEKACQD